MGNSQGAVVCLGEDSCGVLEQCPMVISKVRSKTNIDY